MTFGLTIEKLLLIGLIAVMIIGPERLPAAAESLRRTIQQARRMARTAHERVREELGPEVADVDWQRLDPRQYDPRRIIREALLDEPEAPAPPVAARVATPAGGAAETESAAASERHVAPPVAHAETESTAAAEGHVALPVAAAETESAPAPTVVRELAESEPVDASAATRVETAPPHGG